MELKDYTTEELERELKKRSIAFKFADYIQKRANTYNFNLPPRSYDIYAFAKDLLAWLEKQNEQKSTDKIEPKFKVGDWIVFNKGKDIYKVEKIENYEYTLRHILGGSMPLSFSGEGLIRKWTIEDAKDGDVLVHSSFMFDNFIFIYNNTSILQAYCYYSNERNRFIIEDRGHPCPWNMQEVTPATKEQRDLLFTKMKEAGYEWNANKKELKKIEDEKKQDITERIKTFEDAYNKLGNDHPFVRAFNGYVSHIHERNMNDYDLIAYLKLRIITAALNEGWEPQFTQDEERWYFWYNLISKAHYDKLSAVNKSYVVYRDSNSAYVCVGLICAGAKYASSVAGSGHGSRLCFKSKKLAEYAGRQFVDIYADFCFRSKSE